MDSLLTQDKIALNKKLLSLLTEKVEPEKILSAKLQRSIIAQK